MSNEKDREPAEETAQQETGGEESGSATELQVAALTEQLEAAQAEAEKYRGEVLYKEAELQTARRRFAEQRGDLIKYRDEDLLHDLLPVIEGLELALNADVTEQWGEGVKLAVREMKRHMELRGVTLIDPDAGQPFDPNEHEALAYQGSDRQPPEHIIQLVRPGYRLHDRLLRPAQVIVAREL